jgi:hypothetical protein
MQDSAGALGERREVGRERREGISRAERWKVRGERREQNSAGALRLRSGLVPRTEGRGLRGAQRVGWGVMIRCTVVKVNYDKVSIYKNKLTFEISGVGDSEQYRTRSRAITLKFFDYKNKVIVGIVGVGDIGQYETRASS